MAKQVVEKDKPGKLEAEATEKFQSAILDRKSSAEVEKAAEAVLYARWLDKEGDL